MKRPPHDPGRFEEHRREQLRVEPQYGRAGTEFHFKAFHFERHKSVRVAIKGPKNFVVLDILLTTDDDGSISRDGLSRIASENWPLGVYTFSVEGLTETFILTR